MALPFPLRPVLVGVLALSASGCGFVESDPRRFEALAQRVADIPVTMERPASLEPKETLASERRGLRPAYRTPLQVEVLEPHAFWDAREGLVDQVVEKAAPRIAEAAAPMVVEAVAATARRSLPYAALPEPTLRPALGEPDRLIQLGAFSSDAAARAAWTRLAKGEIAALTPVYQPVEVNGRTLVRLKVAAPARLADRLCAEADAAAWCARRA